MLSGLNAGNQGVGERREFAGVGMASMLSGLNAGNQGRSAMAVADDRLASMLSGLNAGNQGRTMRRGCAPRSRFNAVRLERRKSGEVRGVRWGGYSALASMLSGLNAGNQALRHIIPPEAR